MSEKIPLESQQSNKAEKESGGATLAPPQFKLSAGAGDDNGGQAIQKKDESAEKAPAADSGGFTVHNNGSTIVTIPKKPGENLPILAIVGGIDYANKEWMKSQTPSNLFETHILSFSNHGTGYTKGVKPAIEAAMTKDKVTGTYKGIIGFSKGGERVAAAKGDENWSFLGMIDPSISYLANNFQAPVYMIWNTWNGNSLEKDPRSQLHNKIVSGKVTGESERKIIKHKEMPQAWFAKFAGIL